MMTTKFKFLFASLAFAGIATLSAQTVGYVTRTIPAGSLVAPTTTLLSVPFSDSLSGSFVGQGSGAITGVTANTLTNSSAGWTSGFVTATNPYFVRITSGPAIGRTYRVTAATTTQLTLTVVSGKTDLVTLGVAAGNTYQLFPAETLGTLFNSLPVLGATSATSADNVLLFNGTIWVTYFYNSTAGQWRSGGFPTDQTNTVISPDSGMIYIRRGNTPMSFVASGVVPESNLSTEINSNGPTFLAGLFPVDNTLGGLNIQNTAGWVSGTSATGTDKVLIWNGTIWVTYFYNNSAGQWRSGGFPTNQNGVVVPAGAPVLVTKATPVAGSNTFTLNKPY